MRVRCGWSLFRLYSRGRRVVAVGVADEVYLLVRHAAKRGVGVKESKGQTPSLPWIHEVAVVRQARHAV